jgi:hypothetical protein
MTMYQDPYRQPPSYPSPYGAPPPSYNNDLSHLKILSIGHYVLGALTALFGLFPLVYVFLGALVIVAPPSSKPGDPPPPTAVGWVFVAFGVLFSLAIWFFAFGAIYAGRQIAKHQKHTFCLVMAAFICLLFMPLGTILGIFTFIVLQRDSVKQLFTGGMPGNVYR